MKRSRNALRRMAAGIAMAAAVVWTGLAETVTNVRGVQREKSNLVDIYYDLEASGGGSYTVKLEIEGRTNEVKAATFTGDVGSGVTPGKNRHIVWDAGTDWPGKKGDVKAKVTATKTAGGSPRKVQLWEGGPYWADRNVGASSPEDYGSYFEWGPKGLYLGTNWITNGVLAPNRDVAHVRWGGSWRLPTKKELDDLTKKCDSAWTTLNCVTGVVFRGMGAYASNSIFLPAGGYIDGGIRYSVGDACEYWSAEPYTSSTDRSWMLFLFTPEGGHGGFSVWITMRNALLSVRPVSTQ